MPINSVHWLLTKNTMVVMTLQYIPLTYSVVVLVVISGSTFLLMIELYSILIYLVQESVFSYFLNLLLVLHCMYVTHTGITSCIIKRIGVHGLQVLTFTFLMERELYKHLGWQLIVIVVLIIIIVICLLHGIIGYNTVRILHLWI